MNNVTAELKEDRLILSLSGHIYSANAGVRLNVKLQSKQNNTL